jgi:hypothetical protein
LDDTDRQSKGDALLAELRAKGISRDCIRDDLVAGGFTPEEATDLLDGIPLSPRPGPPPPPPPSLDELRLHAAREIVAAREPSGGSYVPGAELEDPTSMSFWEGVLGGRREAGWILEVPGVAEAVTADDRLGLYRLLERQRSFAPSPDAREMLDDVLMNERLFVSDGASPPTRLRVFGFHFSLRVDFPQVEQLGTSLGTVWFMFAILPLAPVGRFVLAPNAAGQLTYLGEVPLTRFQEWWKRAALVALVAFMAWVALRVATRAA